MSENKRATPKQVETITKIAVRLYGSTASTVIGIASNYPLLNAIGAGDKVLAAKLLSDWIDADQKERADYKASHPKEALPVAQ